MMQNYLAQSDYGVSYELESFLLIWKDNCHKWPCFQTECETYNC